VETNLTVALQKVRALGYNQRQISNMISTNQSTVSRLIRGLSKGYYSKGIRENPSGIATNERLLAELNKILDNKVTDKPIKTVEFIDNKPVIYTNYTSRGHSENKHIKSRVPSYELIFNLYGLSNIKLGTKKFIGFAGLNGDEKFLLESGIKADNIIFCDKDDQCLGWSRANKLNIPPRPICNDLIETINWTLKNYGPYSIANINVDLMGSIKQDQHILWFIKNLGIKTTVSVTFTCRGPTKHYSLKHQDYLLNLMGYKDPLLNISYRSKSEFSNGSVMFTRVYKT
jgi:hypothetical protein